MSVQFRQNQDGDWPSLWLPTAVGPRIWLPENRANLKHHSQPYKVKHDLYAVSEDTGFLLRSSLAHVPIEEFLGLVSRVSLTRTTDSQSLSDFVRVQGWKPEVALRQYQLALLVGLILEQYDKQTDRAWETTETLGKLRQLVVWSNMTSNILAAADKPSPKDDYDDAAAAMVRLANQQFGDFEGARSLYTRAYFIFRECCKEGEQRLGTTLSAVLEGAIGLDLDKILFLPLGLFTMLSKSKGGWLIEPDIMTHSEDFPAITRSDVESLFDWLSIDYEGFRLAGQQVAGAEEGYEPYKFNPLVEHPIIRTPTGRYVVPIIHYLFRRVTVGLFYDLIRSKDAGRAGNILGHSLELYVRRLIEDLPQHGPLLPEQSYGEGETSCEWILQDAEAIVVIECKRISLRQRAKTTGDRAEVKRDLATEGGVADGVTQLAKTVDAIRQGRIKGVGPDRRILPLLMTFDLFFLANTTFMRSIIEEILTERSVTMPAGFDYQICSIADFEELCAMLGSSGGSVAAALISKVAGEYDVVRDRPTREWDLSSWVMRAQGSSGIVTLPTQEEVFHQGLDSIIGQFHKQS